MTLTRQQIAEKVVSMLGIRFLHQGRSRLGLDCAGLPHLVFTELGIESLVDVEGYKASPSSRVIYETLSQNFDEIPVNEVGVGDMYLMRIGGRKAKHLSFLISDFYDLENGIEPEIVHVRAIGQQGSVVKEKRVDWITKCVTGFRCRELA